MKKKVALALVAALAMGVFVGCSKPAEEKTTTYTDGTYTGVGKGYGGDVKVSVEVKDGKISKVDLVDIANETPGIGGQAAPKVAERIVEAQSAEVEAESGATMTSNGIMEAVKNALEGK